MFAEKESLWVRSRRFALIALVTLFFCIANGINFSFTNFLTVFAVQSNLALTKSLGARATATYFAASATMKFISIFCIAKVPALFLVLVDLAFLAAGNGLLLWLGDAETVVFFVGVFCVGVGIREEIHVFV